MMHRQFEQQRGGVHAGLILNLSNSQVMFVLKLIFPSPPANLSQNQFHGILGA